MIDKNWIRKFDLSDTEEWSAGVSPPILGMVKKHDAKRKVWVVRPLRPAPLSQYLIPAEDFDYDDVAVNDLVDVYVMDEGYKATRHSAKAQ